MDIDMYSQPYNKTYAVDYFVYTPNCMQRHILSYLTCAVSRKMAEQEVRDLEKGQKITIVKINTFDMAGCAN